jgi:hypothetical protein
MRALLPAVLFLLPVLACADFDAGQGAYERGDYRRALAELVPAADQDARAALLLADMFERGIGVERSAQQALLWRRRAADLGEAQAQFELGRQYLEGRQVPVQPREAALWFERAAGQGHTEARFALGKMLAEGRGMPPDPAEGRRLIERAADEGLAAAQAWLGRPASTAPKGKEESNARATAPSTPAPEPSRSAPSEGDVRAGPDIHYSWGVYKGWGSGWYGFERYGGFGPYPWGWYPYGWYPYGWYPYGYPGSSVQFGFHFSN